MAEAETAAAPSAFAAFDVGEAARGAPTDAEFEAAPEVLRSSLPCSARRVRDHVRLRCTRAKGGAPGILDVTTTAAGGWFRFAHDAITWTFATRDIRANGLLFDDGVYEVAHLSGGALTLVLDGTYHDGFGPRIQKAMSCCIAEQSPDRCFAVRLAEAAIPCTVDPRASCGDIDRCTRR